MLNAHRKSRTWELHYSKLVPFLAFARTHISNYKHMHDFVWPKTVPKKCKGVIVCLLSGTQVVSSFIPNMNTKLKVENSRWWRPQNTVENKWNLDQCSIYVFFPICVWDQRRAATQIEKHTRTANLWTQPMSIHKYVHTANTKQTKCGQHVWTAHQHPRMLAWTPCNQAHAMRTAGAKQKTMRDKTCAAQQAMCTARDADTQSERTDMCLLHVTWLV